MCGDFFWTMAHLENGHNSGAAFEEREAFHECGLFAVVLEKPSRDIHAIGWNGLTAQQNRGEEGAGWSCDVGYELYCTKALGKVAQALPWDMMTHLPASDKAVGQLRYSVTGLPTTKNSQPFLFDTPQQFTVSHNGNVHWAHKPLRDEPTSDTYGIGKAIAERKGYFLENVIDTLSQLNGAYTMFFLTGEGVYVAVDPWGFRLPEVGKLTRNGITGMVAASETVGLLSAGAEYMQTIPRGALVRLHHDGVETIWTDSRVTLPEASCTFDKPVYFADAASRTGNEAHGDITNHSLRVELGKKVAEGSLEGFDQVTPVPNSGWSYAEGVAIATGLPVRQAIHANRFRGRNFTQPHTPQQRMEAAFQKYRFIPELIVGKKMKIVDDSLVRGYTTQGLTLALFHLGAEEIEYLIGAPPIKAPCFWGIDFQDPNEIVYTRLMKESGDMPYEERLALWLVGGDRELAKRVHIKFQQLEDYVAITRGVPVGTPVEKSGGCYHCVSGIEPEGIVVDFSMQKKRFE